MDAKAPSSRELKQIFDRKYLKNLNRDKLIQRLRKLASVLGKFDQEPSESIKDVPGSLLQTSLMRNKNQEVQILTAICHSEVLRIYAPDPPYKTPALKNVFQLILSQLPGLSKVAGQHYSKYFHLLESLYITKSHLILNDIDDDESLRSRMFQTFFDLKQNEVSSQVEFYMVEIMKALLEESEGITQNIFDIVLGQMTPAQSDSNPGGCDLALSLVSKCESILEHPISQFFKEAVIEGNETESSIGERKDFFDIMYKLSIGAPDTMYPILTEYSGHLMNENVDVRLEACEFFGKLFSAKEFVFAAQYQNLIMSHIDRLNDVDSRVRSSVLDILPSIMLRCEGPSLKRLQSLLKSRVEDSDPDIRAAAVKCIVTAATENPGAVTPDLLLKMGGRALDKKLNVRRDALVGMANLFKKHIAERWKSGKAVDKSATRLTWLPTRLVQVGKVDTMMQYFVEGLLDEVVLPESYTPAERVRCLVGIYVTFSPESTKVFKRIMIGKKAMHDNMRKVLDAWNNVKIDKEAMQKFEIQAKLVAERLPTPGQNFEGWQIIKDVLKDPNPKVIKILEKMVNPETDYRVLRASRQEIMSLLGLKGQPYLFVKRLTQRLCNTILPVDGISTLTTEVANHMSKGRKNLADAGLRLMEIAASNFPSTFLPSIRNLISLATDTSDTYVPGVLRILASLNLQEADKTVSKTLGVKLKPLVKSSVPEIAKLAARSICKANTSSSEVQKLATSLKSNLAVDGKLASKLRSLGEIALQRPLEFASAAPPLVLFVKDKLLLETPTKKNRALLQSCKTAGIKLLQNYALGLEDPDSAAQMKVFPIINDLVELLGEKIDGIHIPIAKAILKLCKVPQYFEKVQESPQIFCNLALIVETDDTQEFLTYVLKRMFTDTKFPFAFFAYLAFGSHLSHEKMRMISARMRQLIMRERRKITLYNDLTKERSSAIVAMYPEATTAHLIYILSKHPSMEDDGPQYRHILKILDFFFDSFYQGNQENNYSLIVNILATIKLHRDRHDVGNDELYRVAEVANKALKAKFKGKQWKEEAHPMQIPLPRWLFKRKKDGAIQGEHQYLPSDFKLTSPTRRPKKKKEPSEGEEDEEYVPGRKSFQRKKKRKSSKKVDEEDDYEENVPANTPNQRPRHSRATRSNTKAAAMAKSQEIDKKCSEGKKETPEYEDDVEEGSKSEKTKRKTRTKTVAKSPKAKRTSKKRPSPSTLSSHKKKSRNEKNANHEAEYSGLEVEEVSSKRRSRRSRRRA